MTFPISANGQPTVQQTTTDGPKASLDISDSTIPAVKEIDDNDPKIPNKHRDRLADEGLPEPSVKPTPENLGSTRRTMNSMRADPSEAFIEVLKAIMQVANSMRTFRTNTIQTTQLSTLNHSLAAADEEEKANKARKLGAMVQGIAQVAGGVVSFGTGAYSAAKTASIRAANPMPVKPDSAATPATTPLSTTPAAAGKTPATIDSGAPLPSAATPTSKSTSTAPAAAANKPATPEADVAPPSSEKPKSLRQRQVEATEESNKNAKQKLENKPNDDYTKKVEDWNRDLGAKLEKYRYIDTITQSVTSAISGTGNVARALYDADAGEHDVKKSRLAALSKNDDAYSQLSIDAKRKIEEDFRASLQTLDTVQKASIDSNRAINRIMG